MKLGDLRKKLRGLTPPACDCPDAATGEHYNECTPEHPWRRRKVWTELGGRPLDREIAPPWSDGKERVIGLDVGMGGDSTSIVEMSRGPDGVITVDSLRTVREGKEISFTGVHRVITEPEDMSKRRICKAVNAVPGAVLTDHRYCATGVRRLGKSLGDIYLEKHSGQWNNWNALANSVAMGLRDANGRVQQPYFIVCPSTSDELTLVKWFGARGRAYDVGKDDPPDEPMHRMFGAVSAKVIPDSRGVAQAVKLARCSAFALYPAETRACWTCEGKGITTTIARVSEDEPETAACERCRGFGRLWDWRPHHAPTAAEPEVTDARAKRFEDGPPPSRHD